jgi:dipeptidyl aminopeptidase/acylaminoacyl peptidase
MVGTRAAWPALYLLGVLCCPVAARADEPRRDHDITVDDYFTQADIMSAVVSPDGRLVAYAEGRWQQSTDDRKTDLWIADSATRKVRRLTFDRPGVRVLRWSPDSHSIYFLANRKRAGETAPPYDGGTQVWCIGVSGEPTPVTRAEGGVEAYDLTEDAQTLYYVTEAEHIDDEWKSLQQEFKDLQYGHGVRKLSLLWKLNLENWRTEKVLEPGRVIRDMAVAPDGGRIAMITTPDDRVVSFEGQSRVDVYDTRSRKTNSVPDRLFRQEAPSPYGWLEHLAWSADSNAVAFEVIFDAYPAEVLVAEWTGPEPAVVKLKRPDGVSLAGYGGPLAWRGRSRELGWLAEEKARVRLATVEIKDGKQGEVKILTPGDVVVQNFQFSKSGQAGAVLMSDPKHLVDVYLFRDGEAQRPLTHVNPQADTWKLPQVSLVSWKGAHGDTVEGILELPPDYKHDHPLPLVLEIHGGPTTATRYELQYWIYGRTLLPAKGYALLAPNYRGSTGYGDKFLTELVGHENELDVEDILKGVDALVERGIADPNRLGVSGWSNGGFLTNCLITKTTRFKAASTGAGIMDAVTEWGTNDEPAYTIIFKTGLPWKRPDVYRRVSPVFGLENVRTPTLIHVGASDERCPPGNSRMLYRALKEYLHVPTELVVYPGEPHGLMKYRHRKAKMEWDLAWYEKYLRGTGSPAAQKSAKNESARN